MNLFGEEDKPADAAYRVLARKYRPTSFETLIGQDVLVRTLSNAIRTGRLAHAFLLTGIRGVGKTTTARIIARALNCIGEDGKSGPTITPCGVCANCRMIAEDRHMDVMEMDAASRTGVNDIRELIETVHYAPTNARYKIYIIDEVHMLSNSAFNALLKTLEEPPPHVKFIFATTELRKIPVTILSRCQTFDLKRVDGDVLTRHLAGIAAKEGVEVDDAALRLIANAAEGSVRDSLSLLDQAIAHGTGEDGTARIKADIVRAMLGMADRSRSFELLAHLFAGETKAALHGFKAHYDDGAEPVYLLQELMELVHLTTRMKLVPDLADSPELAEQERRHAQELAAKLNMAQLTRAWQLLSKGLQEARLAPNPYMAAEMVLIRVMHASALPSPADIIRTLQENGAMEAVVPRAAPSAPLQGGGLKAPSSYGSASSSSTQAAAQPIMQRQEAPVASAAMPQSFAEAVELFQKRMELVLWTHLFQNVQLVKFEAGRMELNPSENVPSDLAGRVGKLLTEWTGLRWVVVVSAAPGQPSLKEQAQAGKRAQLEEARRHPLVDAVMRTFEGAKVIDFARPERVHLLETLPMPEPVQAADAELEADNANNLEQPEE